MHEEARQRAQSVLATERKERKGEDREPRAENKAHRDQSLEVDEDEFVLQVAIEPIDQVCDILLD